jgi:hypothetical protein
VENIIPNNSIDPLSGRLGEGCFWVYAIAVDFQFLCAQNQGDRLFSVLDIQNILANGRSLTPCVKQKR